MPWLGARTEKREPCLLWVLSLGGAAPPFAWDGFVRILRSILGLPNDSTNALSQALNLGVAAMRADMSLRKQGVQAGTAVATMASELRGLARAAVAAGNANTIVNLGALSEQELALLQGAGVAVEQGYSHAADMFAVRHALNRHSDAKVEASRGQIAITEDDGRCCAHR